MNRAKKIGRFTLIAIIGIILFTVGKFFLTWDRINIDENLNKKALFKKFDSEKQSYIDGGLAEEIKTNNFKTKTDSTDFYSCHIYNNKLFLKIYFGAGDGFSGRGYQIDILNNRYKISPYHYTDIHRFFDFLETEEYYKTLENQLILDKTSYKKGDSIFGHIKFKIQRRYGPEKYFEDGEGYFKGLVN